MARMGSGLAIGVCLWLAARSAAASPKVATRLVWHGSICGSAEDFAARVLDRTSAVRFVRRGQQLAVRLRIARRGSGLDASVSIEARGREPLERHIESPDCDDALDALALVVAIGIEGRPPPASAPTPRGRRKPPATPEPSEAPDEPPEPTPVEVTPTESAAPVEAASPQSLPSPEPEASANPATTLRASSPPAPAPPAAPAAPSEPEVDARAPAPSHVSGPFHLGVGLSAQSSIGIAPSPVIGGALWFTTAWERPGLWSPEVIVSATHQRRDGLPSDAGEADFALSAAGISLCPLRLGSGPWRLRPCAAGTFGRLASEGHDTYDPRSTARPWSALGTTLELTAAIGIFELRVSLGGAAPLIRDGFRFGAPCSGAACEADVFHRVAPVIWSGAAGAGVNFW